MAPGLPPNVALLVEAARKYERDLLRGIASYSQLQGPWQFFRRLPFISGGDMPSIEQVRSWEPDALILREAPDSQAFLDMGLPTVYAPSTEVLEGLPNITVDDRGVGRLAARHLISCGLRQFAYCGIDELFFWSRRRRDGFLAELEDHGFSGRVYVPPSPREHVNWNRDLPALREWLSSLPTPIGVMVCTDDFSLLVTEACKAAGRSVPEDVAIIGVGNDEAVCELTSVPLSSVGLNTERGGYEAANQLAKLMAGESLDGNIVIHPTEVIQRRSTDVVTTSDPHVSQAIRFIRDNVSKTIHVDDVVRQVPLSRRALYDRFRAVTNQSIYDYIRHSRLDLFTRLLLETNLSVSEIAFSMGYSDDTNICRFFRKLKGMTPLAYRRQHGKLPSHTR